MVKELKKIKVILFLDDIRPPEFVISDGKNMKIIHAKSYEKFVKYIEENGLPDKIYFDHDLGYAEGKSGYDCAKFLVDYCITHDKKLPKYHVHSMNPVGKENIEKLLKGYENMKRKELFDFEDTCDQDDESIEAGLKDLEKL